mgnify:FL=1
MVLFPLVSYQMVVTNFFQCIGKVKVSIFLSLSRQLIFLLPLIILLPLALGVDGVWYAMPISDMAAVITAVAIMPRYIKKLRNTTKAPQHSHGQ